MRVDISFLLFIIIFVVIFITCKSNEDPRVKWPCYENSLEECAGDHYTTPPLCRCTLSKDIIYNGIDIPKDSLIGRPDKYELNSATISKSIKVFNITFPKGTEINFDNENDWVRYFDISDDIPVYVDKYPCSYSIRIYKNGQFWGCYTTEKVFIQDNYCKGGIYFYKNGQLKGCCDANAEKCTTFDEGYICFDEVGNSISCEGLSK